ncbi:MAG: DUF4982 domain-containing protein [Bacteroidales bacterium]|nr:DUF4982 domain-containing protein [Bacteroidales bacterium]
MRKLYKFGLVALFIITVFTRCTEVKQKVRKVEDFNYNWKFILSDIQNPEDLRIKDNWRSLNLPHDWSIEGEFGKEHPATTGGGALPGGIGWYRKTFTIPESDSNKLIFIDFDGIYMNSEVWINGNYLGKRPNGYISFRYELTPYLYYGNKENNITVKVDNSKQPNSRWYSGSGIYRNVKLVTTNKIYIDHWGTFITTPEVTSKKAKINIKINVRNLSGKEMPVDLKTIIYNQKGGKVSSVLIQDLILNDTVTEINQQIQLNKPLLWSIGNPNLYNAVSEIIANGKLYDDYNTPFGIRYFNFDSLKGFSLNGKHMKILGVCNHHDLGCLGTAINTRALEHQIKILKEMGCNSIRTSHNPPAPELLDLCDRMGFLVMDEMFDMWKKNKTPFDFGLYWDEWHNKDLRDFVNRDKNHPSVIVWSIGNEILEQWDTSGTRIAKELVSIVKSIDLTRPITTGNNEVNPWNNIIKSGVLDLIGFNYHHEKFLDFHKNYPGQKFIATETNSALATRGHYDMPSDSIRRWPRRWDIPFNEGNPDNTCSSYDNCSAPWGSTHEETWKVMKNHDFLSGMYIWTGFDYLGEPTPYGWPSRSSYFGIIDLAGFPKDAYYFYKAEWTDEPVLHIFPHWNWNTGDIVDVWAYTNLDEVELFLNGISLGIRTNADTIFHLVWKVKYSPGEIKAIGKKDGEIVMEKIIKTAQNPHAIELNADRNILKADGMDLSFITVKVIDENGTIVPYADNLINFEIKGEGMIAGVDNGCQTSHEPFQASYRKAFNGLCLAVIRSTEKTGEITLTATSEGLKSQTINIKTTK